MLAISERVEAANLLHLRGGLPAAMERQHQRSVRRRRRVERVLAHPALEAERDSSTTGSRRSVAAFALCFQPSGRRRGRNRGGH